MKDAAFLYGTPTLPPQASSDINLFWIILKIFLYLLFIIAFAFFILWIFKRKKGTPIGLIQIIGTKPIAPGKYIQIVEIIDRILILGIGENINILSEITNKETIDLIKEEAGKIEALKNPDLSFAHYLFKKKIDFLDDEEKRLKKI